ncbi:MAG: hypothetical protein LBC12_06090 [Nitrososphaerota archaeon]|nr:hypothetical protein [Nitrososphaerota archaeon]
MEIDVVWADRVEVEAAEFDEMESFVHDKSHQCWLGGPLTITPGQFGMLLWYARAQVFG